MSNPSDKVANDKRAKGETVTLDDLNPGLAWSLDFSENMGQILAVHGELAEKIGRASCRERVS